MYTFCKLHECEHVTCALCMCRAVMVPCVLCTMCVGYGEAVCWGPTARGRAEADCGFNTGRQPSKIQNEQEKAHWMWCRCVYDDHECASLKEHVSCVCLCSASFSLTLHIFFYCFLFFTSLGGWAASSGEDADWWTVTTDYPGSPASWQRKRRTRRRL